MTKGRNTSVIAVRVNDWIVECLKGEAERRKMDFSDYLRSLLATYWRLPSSVVVVEPGVGGGEEGKQESGLVRKVKSGLGDKEEPVEGECYENGFPKRDIKGSPIPKIKWDIVMQHRQYSCPCGSGKKFKKCCGKAGFPVHAPLS